MSEKWSGLQSCQNCRGWFAVRYDGGNKFCSNECANPRARSGEEIISLFVNKINFAEGCWEWSASKTERGYGVFCTKTKLYTSNRASYLMFNGFLKQDECACHTCDNRICVNPWHLFAGTKKDNHDDAKRKGRHTCKLNDCLVRFLRVLGKRGYPVRRMAKELGVGYSAVYNAIRGITWAHVL